MLLAIWGDVGSRMRTLLQSISLADIAEMARGAQAWPTGTGSV